MKKLYEYSENFRRMGHLSGRILLDDEEHSNLMGKEGIAGEALGKHSEVPIRITVETLRLITDDEAFLKRAEELGVELECGFDPRRHLDKDDDDDE